MEISESDKQVNDFIQKLSSKKTKEKYKIIDKFQSYCFPSSGDKPRLSKESLSLLLEGDIGSKMIGLLDVSGK